MRSLLFVCTGNTCRSPLAEVLCKKLLAERLGCTIEELPSKGFVVKSAGVATWPGMPASLEAENAAKQAGADLQPHRSQPLNPELLENATDVFAMTASHAAIIMERFGSYGPLPTLLCETEDLEDPIGADSTVYKTCVDKITLHLNRLAKDWLAP